MSKATHPTAKRIKAGEQLVAHIHLLNGHAYQVCLTANDAMTGDEDDFNSEIALGFGSDPEEAIAHAISDMEEMIVALRKHAVGLNHRSKKYEEELKAKRAEKLAQLPNEAP